MKILRIIARLNIGGPARNAVILTEGFSDTVLVCGEVDKAEGDMMYLAREKGMKPIIVEELGRELSWKDDWSAFWKIYKIICREKPDIIHTHTAKAGALGRMAGILYNLNKPRRMPAFGEATYAVLIHTFHGHVFSGYFGKIKTVFFIWTEKILALFTDKIITVSRNLKDELAHKYRIALEKKIEVIELGFELDELFALPLKESSEVINIGIVGRLVPIKNHKMLFRACRAGLNLPYRIIVVGDGELRCDLEKYAEELGMCDKIKFKGWVKDLKAIYEELDIVALTSLNEGTPVSLIEAMASGRPVITTNVGGVKDIVEDNKSGYLVESGDEESFSQKLMDLIKDSEKRKKFGEYGRNIVKNRFSKERLIKDTGTLYNNTLQKK
ncbi:MAG: glycosyltransferase family 4 protein [Candidatus Omnitrophica bacterium]|nr:glycosyltransferase family 4 protein [Candidatus Omnitrophota bacterium]